MAKKKIDAITQADYTRITEAQMKQFQEQTSIVKKAIDNLQSLKQDNARYASAVAQTYLKYKKRYDYLINFSVKVKKLLEGYDSVFKTNELMKDFEMHPNDFGCKIVPAYEKLKLDEQMNKWIEIDVCYKSLMTLVANQRTIHSRLLSVLNKMSNDGTELGEDIKNEKYVNQMLDRFLTNKIKHLKKIILSKNEEIDILKQRLQYYINKVKELEYKEKLKSKHEKE